MPSGNTGLDNLAHESYASDSVFRGVAGLGMVRFGVTRFGRAGLPDTVRQLEKLN
jgi:hypothetical protein